MVDTGLDGKPSAARFMTSVELEALPAGVLTSVPRFQSFGSAARDGSDDLDLSYIESSWVERLHQRDLAFPGPTASMCTE